MTLSPLQIATLVAFYDEVGLSTNAHIPMTAIQRHFPKHSRGFCRKTLKKLVKMRFVRKHPTGGSMTYSLTPKGVDMIKEYIEKP